jgi:hypothetical protein
MKDHTDGYKAYIHTSQAWYAKTALCNTEYIDHVNFGFYSPNGGTSGEMSVKWYPIKQNTPAYPRLECFDDAWHALSQFKDVIDAMAEVDDQSITPEQFCLLLERCDFVDRTPRRYEDSYPEEEPAQ